MKEPMTQIPSSWYSAVDAAEFLIRSDFGREVTEVDGDDPNGPRRSVHQVKFFPTTRSELEAEVELLSPKS